MCTVHWMWANVTKLDRRPFYKCYLPPWDQFKGKTIGENKTRGGGWPQKYLLFLGHRCMSIKAKSRVRSSGHLWKEYREWAIQMFALWNLSFDLFFLYDVGGGGWWVKVGGGFVSATWEEEGTESERQSRNSSCFFSSSFNQTFNYKVAKCWSRTNEKSQTNWRELTVVAKFLAPLAVLL